MPPLLQIPGNDGIEAGEIAFFGFHRLDQLEQRPAKPDRISRIGGRNQRHPVKMVTDRLRQGLFPGQHQIGKAQGGCYLGNRRFERQGFGIGGLEKPGVIIGFAQCADRREDRRSLADQIGQFRAQCPGGATGGNEYRGSGER